MTRLLIRSDRLVIRSDDTPGSFLARLAQTSPPADARLAADRIRPAWHIGRDLQALRPTELPLHRRTGTWTQAISFRQPAWRAPAQELRAREYPFAGCPTDRQLSQVAQSARRDLCDQYGTPAATRGSWIDHHGRRSRRFRFHQGGRRPRRHDCILSCRRRPAVRSGGAK